MSKAEKNEKFKTTIGGQALIEGIMMRGPEKDAIVIRGKEGLQVETSPRKVRSPKSPLTWPLLRGPVVFFDSQVVGVKALMRSADLSPDEELQENEPSKLDQWLEKKLGDKRFQNFLIGTSVALGLVMSIALFFLLPGIISSFLMDLIPNVFLLHLMEGVIRILIFVIYLLLVSRMKEMKRVFAYHGAEHKTIRCYEAGLPLTVENVRKQTRMHPRCGTSFLLVVMIISILIFSVASSLILMVFPTMQAVLGKVLYRVVMLVLKLLLLPVVVSISYEINRFVGRHDNWFTRLLTGPGMWFQNFTTCEPDDSMIEVGIAALEAVIPEQEGADQW